MRVTAGGWKDSGGYRGKGAGLAATNLHHNEEHDLGVKLAGKSKVILSHTASNPTVRAHGECVCVGGGGC